MAAISLMPHQKKAIRELRSGSILCGGVGTGKSLTALAYYYIYVCRGVLWGDAEIGPMLEPRPLYIITTARKRDTNEWEDELKKFELDDGTVEVTIDSWNNLHKYVNVYGAFFIFDEQRVTGRGKWVRSFYKVAKKNKWILLTATPGDTWLDYVPVFVANGFYKNRSAFLAQHAVYNPYITKFPKIERFTDTMTLERHRRDITVKMIFEKHTKRHWKSVFDNGYDEAKYKTIVKDRWDPWKNEPIKDIAGCCYLMRRVVNENAERCKRALWLALSSYKHRAIIFYNFDYELSLLKEEIEQTLGECMTDDPEGFKGMYGDFEIAEWNGHKHEKIPSSNSWIFLVQYNAGAEGWNCTETDTIIFYSQNYSYKMMEQAAGRIDRMNTPFDDLYYYVLKSHAPIDRAIERALNSKKTFNEKAYWNEEIV